MAELKSGTTIGGAQVWTQGNFPLFPTGNTLLYKNFKIYSENDKPKAVDNDFVSKADGGVYAKNIQSPAIGVGRTSQGQGISLYGEHPATGEANYGIHFSDRSIYGGHGGNTNAAGQWATYFSHVGTTGYPWIFRSKVGTVLKNVASITSTGIFQGPDVILENSPTQAAHATRKDYVDGQINTVKLNADDRVSKAGDTMRGPLTAPNFVSVQPATADTHVPQKVQVVLKGTMLDFGTF